MGALLVRSYVWPNIALSGRYAMSNLWFNLTMSCKTRMASQHSECNRERAGALTFERQTLSKKVAWSNDLVELVGIFGPAKIPRFNWLDFVTVDPFHVLIKSPVHPRRTMRRELSLLLHWRTCNFRASPDHAYILPLVISDLVIGRSAT